jgi:hypothetical protein
MTGDDTVRRLAVVHGRLVRFNRSKAYGHLRHLREGLLGKLRSAARPEPLRSGYADAAWDLGPCRAR